MAQVRLRVKFQTGNQSSNPKSAPMWTSFTTKDVIAQGTSESMAMDALHKSGLSPNRLIRIVQVTVL